MSELGRVSRASPVDTRGAHCTRDEGGPFEVGNQVLTSKRTHADEIEMIFPFGGRLTSPSDGVVSARGSG